MNKALWMQWLHHFNGKTYNKKVWPYYKDEHKGKPYFCSDVEKVLEKMGCHTMVVGHYYDNSKKGMTQFCGVGGDDMARKQLIFSDFGIWKSTDPTMLRVTGETVRMLTMDQQEEVIND